MERLWKAFVLVVASAVVACEASPLLRYEDVVERAIEEYNHGQREKPLFRLLDVTPPLRQDSTTNISLNFRIKETVCISTPERQPKNCAFKEDGDILKCTGEFFKQNQIIALTLTCDKDYRKEAAQVSSVTDYPVTDVPEEDKIKDLPPKIRDIYENAKNGIISNILSNF